MSDVDDMLKGQDDQTPVSQTQTKGQGTELDQPDATSQQSPEEVEFGKLSGNTQERIRKLVQRARDAEEKATMAQSQQYVPPAPINYQSPDNQAAINALENAGVATDRKVDAKLRNSLNQVMWEFEQSRLESKYTGVDGEPKYDRTEVEDYIRHNPQLAGYSAEDVFRYKMFPDEFTEAEVKKRGSSPQGGSRTLRPTKSSVHEETLTPEYIAEMTDINKVGKDAATRFYDEHKDEIDKVLKNMTPLPQ